MIRLTTDHSASSYGVPVCVDANDNPLDYAEGLQMIRHERKWSVADLASLLGVSARTVEGWEQGRMPTIPALMLLQRILKARGYGG